MSSIAFFDLEVNPKNSVVTDIGAILSTGKTYHNSQLSGFIDFIKDSNFYVGHNIINHDLKYLQTKGFSLPESQCIDTLYLSPLLFPKKPYHKLVKDDKLDPEGANNPLNDSINARDLFYSEVNTFNAIPEGLREIFYRLLYTQREFSGFFTFINYYSSRPDFSTSDLIRSFFSDKICSGAALDLIIEQSPVELAYALALVHCDDKYSIPPKWLLKTFPDLENILYLLRNNPCVSGCDYCNQSFDEVKGLNRIFGFPAFREYDGEPLQQSAVQAALNNKSLLAIFPTGGGKSITFQLPALMAAENTRGLTVVISPLISGKNQLFDCR